MKPTAHLLDVANALDVCAQALRRAAGRIPEAEAAKLMNRIVGPAAALGTELVPIRGWPRTEQAV